MEPRSLRVAAVQLNSQSEVAQNLDECRARVGLARAAGATVVLLPENFAYMGQEEGKRGIAERLDDPDAPICSALAQMAADNGITIVAGGLPERSADPARPYNTCAVFNERGELAGRYRKIHLFDVELRDGSNYRESNATAFGDEPIVVDAGGFKLGLSICYDLRFPELYRALVDRGAEVLFVPAAFTLHTGKDHWHVLLRARAIESQCFVVAAAQWGRHPGNRSTYGHSMIVDPWGTIVAESSDKTGLVVADVSSDDLDGVRRSVPSLRHRRL